MADDKLKWLKQGDLVTFNTGIVQGGQIVNKTIKGAVKSIINDVVFLDNNYFFDMETHKRMMQPIIMIQGIKKPLLFIKKNRITDYQKVNEDYTGEPTSKYEAIEFIKAIIQKIILNEIAAGGLEAPVYGGGNLFGVQPEYHQDKLNQDKQFPDDSLRIIAKKNMDDIKKSLNMNQQSADDIEKKALEDFCFKYPSLLLYL